MKNGFRTIILKEEKSWSTIDYET